MLAGLLVLFGHDLVMATEPHALASSHADHAETLERTETDCGSLEGSPMSSSTVPDLHAEVALLFVPARALDSPRAAWRIEPSHPPDVRRALLQVYLN